MSFSFFPRPTFLFIKSSNFRGFSFIGKEGYSYQEDPITENPLRIDDGMFILRKLMSLRYNLITKFIHYSK